METTPLLRRNSQDPPRVQSPNRYRVLLLVAVTIVAIDFGVALAYPASIAIFESIICHKLQGESCKGSRVQGELALLTGVRDTMDQIPGLLFALPYGLAADHFGRRPILLLSLYGLIIEEVAIRAICWWPEVLPLRAVWATPIAQALGGGVQIASSIAYAMITDVFPPQDRSSVFFIVAAMLLVGEIVAPPLSSVLMWKNGPWLPFLMGLGFEAVGIATAYALPETGILTTGSFESTSEEQRSTNESEDTSFWRSFNLRALLSRTSEHWLISPKILLVLAAFLFASIGKQAVQLVIQYASLNFEWTIAESTLLFTIKGLVSLIALILVLPRLSVIFSRRMSAFQSDLLIVKGSAWLLTIGAILMAFASHPIPFVSGLSLLACGWGFYSALRSLAIGLVEPDQVGTISTAVAMVQSGGTMISGPLLASAFRFGLSHHRILRGLPYMVAAGFFFIASCLMHYLSRSPTSNKCIDQTDSQADDEDLDQASQD